MSVYQQYFVDDDPKVTKYRLYLVRILRALIDGCTIGLCVVSGRPACPRITMYWQCWWKSDQRQQSVEPALMSKANSQHVEPIDESTTRTYMIMSKRPQAVVLVPARASVGFKSA